MLLILLYILSSFPFAYATDVDSIRPEDHNHVRLMATPLLDMEYEDVELREAAYEAEFVGVDRGIVGRATTDPTALINNRMVLTNVEQGQLVSYMFSNSSLWADKSPATSGLPSQITLQGRSIQRAGGGGGGAWGEDDDEAWEEQDLRLRARQTTSAAQRTLYITVTTCAQPQPISNTTTNSAPQLKLYVSQSSNNTNPGPNSTSNADVVALVDGYVLYEANATGAVYMGVYADNSSSTYSGVYSAQIAASIDGPYHYYWNSSDPNLFLIDSDDTSALLFTGAFITNSTNVTLLEEWMSTSPPFVIFASDVENTSILGMQNSYCGLQNSAQIAASRPGQTVSNIQTGMTSIGDGTLPKQQFYVDGLGAGKTYNAILAMNGNSTAAGDGVVGGGGQVFRMTSFSTLTGTYSSQSKGVWN
jgi:calcium channel MID1